MAYRRAHRALVSVVATLVGCAVITAAGWGVEMVGVPRPTQADRLVASAEGWLRSYPLSFDSFHGRNVHASGICLRTSARSFARSRLAIADGPLFAVTTAHARAVRGSPRPGFPAFLASRIGCTATLLAPVLSAAVARDPVEAHHASVAHESAVALTFPPYKGERLVLYVSPKSGRPFGAKATFRGTELSATLDVKQVNPALIARLRPKLGFRRDERR